MATYTREEFVRAVLMEIGALDGQEAPNAQDYVLANERTQQILEALDDDGLIPFDLDGAFPARFFLPLVQMVAPHLVMPFGLATRAQALQANAVEAKRTLRRLCQANYISAATPATYF